MILYSENLAGNIHNQVNAINERGLSEQVFSITGISSIVVYRVHSWQVIEEKGCNPVLFSMDDAIAYHKERNPIKESEAAEKKPGCQWCGSDIPFPCTSSKEAETCTLNKS